MKELNESTVKMLRSKLEELVSEMDYLETDIKYLEEQIGTLQAELYKKADAWTQKNKICYDIRKLIGYEEA